MNSDIQTNIFLYLYIVIIDIDVYIHLYNTFIGLNKASLASFRSHSESKPVCFSMGSTARGLHSGRTGRPAGFTNTWALVSPNNS